MQRATLSIRFFLFFCLVLIPISVLADEGMFSIQRPDRYPIERMKAMGLSLFPSQIYHPDSTSLKDAVVIFANGCTGVVVSPNGLVLTNHHCGFEAIQQVSSASFDRLHDGFAAQEQMQEVPVDGLTVSFLRQAICITDRVDSVVDRLTDEVDRRVKADSIGMLVIDHLADKERYRAEMIPYSGGLEYYVLVYEVYRDVRLVVAPPLYVGKFGGETDNWMWPRHTGDFAFFRIYTNAEGGAADYAPSNIPMKSKKTAPVSLAGYAEGDFAMTLGYPGETTRFITSWGVEEINRGENEPREKIRAIKQQIWKQAMNRSAALRLKYASTYASSSNYWKYSRGQQEALAQDRVVEMLRKQESMLRSVGLDSLLTAVENAYKTRLETYRALTYLVEAFLQSSDILRVVLAIQSTDVENDEEIRDYLNGMIEKEYSSIDVSVDKQVLKQMLLLYKEDLAAKFLPEIYDTIQLRYQGDVCRYVDHLYKKSVFVDARKLKKRLARRPSRLSDDPFWMLAMSVQMMQFELVGEMVAEIETVEGANRLILEAKQALYPDSLFYPDANFSMRLSYGKVRGFDETGFQTTADEIARKAIANHDDFHVGGELLDLIRRKEYAPYALKNGELPVALLTDNDITGGNSGSPLFNGNGELIGLAFDGNWEGMSGDIAYSQAQRTISVDIRYILFIVDRLLGAKRIVEEIMLPVQ